MTYPQQPYPPQPPQYYPPQPPPSAPAQQPPAYGPPPPAQFQQPQYAPQQYPQQLYGAPAAQAPQPPAPAPAAPPPPDPGTMQDFWDQPGGGGGDSLTWKTIGQEYAGFVVRDVTRADLIVDTDPVTKVVKTYSDDRIRKSLKVTLEVPQSAQFPEGRAAWYVRGNDKDEMVRAMQVAGYGLDDKGNPETPKQGDFVHIRYDHDRPSRMGNAAKIKNVFYVKKADITPELLSKFGYLLTPQPVQQPGYPQQPQYGQPPQQGYQQYAPQPQAQYAPQPQAQYAPPAPPQPQYAQPSQVQMTQPQYQGQAYYDPDPRAMQQYPPQQAPQQQYQQAPPMPAQPAPAGYPSAPAQPAGAPSPSDGQPLHPDPRIAGMLAQGLTLGQAEMAIAMQHPVAQQ